MGPVPQGLEGPLLSRVGSLEETTGKPSGSWPSLGEAEGR